MRLDRLLILAVQSRVASRDFVNLSILQAEERPNAENNHYPPRSPRAKPRTNRNHNIQPSTNCRGHTNSNHHTRRIRVIRALKQPIHPPHGPKHESYIRILNTNLIDSSSPITIIAHHYYPPNPPTDYYYHPNPQKRILHSPPHASSTFPPALQEA